MPREGFVPRRVAMKAVASDAPPAQFTEPYSPPRCVVRGTARGASFSPEGYSLWRTLGQLDEGTEVEWVAPHGDEAVYILTGALDVDGQTVEAPSAIIIEADLETRVRALGKTEVFHVGPTSNEAPSDGHLGPAERDGHSVHLFPLEQVTRSSPDPLRIAARHFTDGSCRTCRIAFFMVDYGNSDGYTSSSHYHTEDEIIHVLDGHLQVGPLSLDPGMSIAIPGDVRYGFRTSGPFRFLNYRRDVSSFVGAPGSEPLVELSSGLKSARQSGDQ
jgi:quercetin dioxygenase-like cupin family protein